MPKHRRSLCSSSDLDIIDDGKKNEAVAPRANHDHEAVAPTSAPASSSSSSDGGSQSVSVVCARKFSTAMLWLRCKGRTGCSPTSRTSSPKSGAAP